MSGISAPAIQSQPTTATPEATTERPGAAASGLETFDDLPPENDQDEGIPSADSGNALENEDNGPDLGAFDFETILNPVLAKKDPAAPAQATQESAPVVATPAAPAVQTPPGQAAPAEAAVVAPTAATPQAAQPQTPQVANARPEEVFTNLSREMEKNRETVVKAVAAHYESLITDEDVELLQTEPKKALAALAGRIHTDGLSNILTVISQQMPSMVYGLMEGVQRQQSATDSFYSANPHLDRAKDSAVVNSIAATLRAQNPNMDSETFKSTLAAMVSVTLKKQPGAAPAAAAPRARAPRGFTPAGSAQAPANGAGKRNLNPWDEYTRVAESEQ